MKKIIFLFSFFVASIHATIAQSNQYLHFDGVDDYVSLPEGAQFVSNTNTITMAGWFYTEELIYGQGMMSIRGGGTGTGEMYLIQLNNGTIECRLVTTTGLHQVVAPEGTIIAGQWQHIAWVFNQTTVELFVDGVSIGSASASGTFQSANRPFSIGKCIQSGFNFIYKGRADEVSLWNKALSQAEIQDMIANELVGDEANLQVYYKFNQGTPGGNNTGISQLLANSGEANKNADLLNFTLNGATSNFGGVLDPSFQVINFSIIPNKIITDAPFEVVASVNSGLPLSYEIVSGPATMNGTTVTLTGTAGTVIVKASQSGNGSFDPAEDAYVSFEVLDPATVLVESTILHPLAGDVYVAALIPVQVAFTAGIEYPELFEIDEISAAVDGENVVITNHGNGYFTGWWTPQSFGAHTLVVVANNNFGASSSATAVLNVLQETTNQTLNGTTDVWVNADYPTQTVQADLPSYSGSFDQIIGTLYIDCPTGGCDPWDRVSHVEVQGKNGEWFEIIRYLTPYGVACQSEIDLTDFSSLLRGKTTFRVNLGTQGNGFLYTLELDYRAGVEVNPFSTVEKLWYQTYQFGDLAELQPTEEITVDFPENTASAKIKLVSSGHGWGNNNTGNAAEFQANTHHVWVNDVSTFEQYNWNICNPNPDGCSPQNGTWYYARAGWCPGSIAQFFDYSMNPFTTLSSVDLNYIFDESYIDYCHINNPNCVSGQTCPDCNDGFNPHLIVASYLITYSQTPMTELGISSNEENSFLSLYPNPSAGVFYVDHAAKAKTIIITDYAGREVRRITAKAGIETERIDLSSEPAGIYLVSITKANDEVVTKKLILE